MTQLVFYRKHHHLPPASKKVLLAQLYGLNGQRRGDISVIGGSTIGRIRRLGVQLPARITDFLSVVLIVTAADIFVQRKSSEGGWARQLPLRLPLHGPSGQISPKKGLRGALHFLNGDIQDFEFCDDGYAPPEPYSQYSRHRLIRLKGLDCISLFSRGLDSTVNTIDFLATRHAPLLASHTYEGDKSRQGQIAEELGG